MIEIVLLGILTGFLSRQLAGITNKLLSYNDIFGCIRFRIAKWLDEERMEKAMKILPKDYDDYEKHFDDAYSEIQKKYKMFTLIICPYCMSFWYCFAVMTLMYIWYIDTYLIFYFLISISFNDIFFKLD